MVLHANRKILAVDNAYSSCSVALLVGEEIIERFSSESRRANQFIFFMIESLLSEAGISIKELDAIAFGSGPGSFTGVRLAASVAQGLCFGSDLPGIPVSTLRAITQGVYREYGKKRVFIALDACLKEIYWAVYVLDDFNLMQPKISDRISKVAELSLETLDLDIDTGAGDAWQVYAEFLKREFERAGKEIKWIAKNPKSYAHDIAVIALDEYKNGNLISAEKCLPVYLKKDLFRKSRN